MIFNLLSISLFQLSTRLLVGRSVGLFGCPSKLFEVPFRSQKYRTSWSKPELFVINRTVVHSRFPFPVYIFFKQLDGDMSAIEF